MASSHSEPGAPNVVSTRSRAQQAANPNKQFDSSVDAKLENEHLEELYDSAKIAEKVNAGLRDNKGEKNKKNNGQDAATLANSQDIQDQLEYEQQGQKLREKLKPIVAKGNKDDLANKKIVNNAVKQSTSKKTSSSSFEQPSIRDQVASLAEKLAVNNPPAPSEVQHATHLVIVPGHAIFMPRPALNIVDDELNDNSNERKDDVRPPTMEMPKDAPAGIPGQFQKRGVIPDSEAPSDAEEESKSLKDEPKKEPRTGSTESEHEPDSETSESTQDTDSKPDSRNPPASRKQAIANSKEEKVRSGSLKDSDKADEKIIQKQKQDTAIKDNKALSGRIQDTVDDDDDLMKFKGESPSTSYASSGNARSAIQKTKFNVFSNPRKPLDAKDEDNWMISSFQRGQTETFLKHIRVAAKITRKDPNAVLVFSGGQTQQFAGPYSEAQSYWTLAASVLNEYDVPDLSYNHEEAADPIQEDIRGKSGGNHLVNRMLVEEYATDSYENLLFSIARFREYTGKYPDLITIVGLEFKKERFQNVHRTALRFPASKFRYVGIDPPELKAAPEKSNNNRDQVTENLNENPDADKSKQSPRYINALLGERKNALEPFIRDPHGCKESLLVDKRRQRNPFRRMHPYFFSCPELFNLFTVCSSDLSAEEMYTNLPWNKQK